MKYFLFFILAFSVLNVSAQKYSFTDSIVLTLKSGVTLTASICKSNTDTLPKSAILLYNIYASGVINRTLLPLAVLRGYVGVVVSTRGKMLSNQEIEPFEHDAEDAYEIIDWISKQKWCNGKVGMYGASYLGFSQWASLKNIHPALKTIVPQASVGVGIDFPMQNSIFSSFALRWIHFVTNNKTIDQADFFNIQHWDSVYKAWYLSGYPFGALDSVEGRPNKIFQRWLSHPDYDDYWKKMTPQNAEYDSINIPILTMTGYYDDDQLGAMNYFKQHTSINKNANHYLIIGPYNHEGIQTPITPSKLLGYQTDSIAKFKVYKLIFDWFDYVLKDSARPALLKDKINYEVMGTNKWEHKPSLNKMNNDTLTFYLSTNKKLSKDNLNPNSCLNIKANLNDRSDTINMSRETQIVDSLIYTNKNVQVFTSELFKKDVEMNGSMFGNINTIINKKDVDLNFQLYELTADGKYFLLNNNLLRASYAKDNSRRQLLTSEKKESIPINNNFFISKLIKQNSRLVFVIGINKNYNWQINYGTGKNVSDESKVDGKIPLDVKIFSDSFIKIPVYKL